jgi:hypothetical protein
MEGKIMKKIFFIFAVMLAIHHNVFSQEAEKNFTSQASPLLWFIDVFSDSDNSDDILFAMDLEGQYKINNSVNISLTLSFLINNHTIIKDYEENISYQEDIYQINLKPMFVYRPFETGLKGFYLSFYPNVGLLHVENPEKNQFFTELGFGLNLGYKWVFSRGFTMQIGGGMGKTFSIPQGSKDFTYAAINSDGRISLAYTDIHLLDFKLGYSF